MAPGFPIDKLLLNLQPRDSKLDEKYKNPNNDYRGRWYPDNLSANGKGGRLVQSCVYPIFNPENKKEYFPPENKCWLYGKEKMDELIKDDRIGFRVNSGSPFLKRFLNEVRQGSTLPTLIMDGGFSVDSSKEIKALFKSDVSEFPKPTRLIKKLLITGLDKNNIILDFFSGSATTAHAVMQLNTEDKGNRKFIMVQLPEQTEEKSEAYKAGYKTIAEIGKERIRRAGNKIIEDNKDKEGIEKLDIGFRVYKTDSTNMKDVYYHPEELGQKTVFDLISNTKEDRTPDDLLTQVILDLGLELNLPIEKKEILGNTVFIVQTNALVACFDDNINFKIVDEIAKLKPFKVVFKDASFKDDKDRINVEERFKRLSPDTVITVI